MAGTNDFVPFSNSTANVKSLASYATLAPPGNVAGSVADSALANRAIRQGSTIASLVAQLMANSTNVNIVDTYNAADVSIPPALYAQLIATVGNINPIFFANNVAGSVSFAAPIYFFCATLTTPPTAGATYTNNGTTFTVISSSTLMGVPVVLAQRTAGSAAPLASGTLTKTGGTGDAAITFYANRKPLYYIVDVKGGGGAGGGAAAVGASSNSAGGGGGEGGRLSSIIQASAVSNGGTNFTVGAGGTAVSGAAGNSGTSSVAFGITGLGGSGGQVVTTTTAQTIVNNSSGGQGSSGTGGSSDAFIFQGACGTGVSLCTTLAICGGLGGGQGGGKPQTITVGSTSGASGQFGGGGAGAAATAAALNASGGAGGIGYVYIQAIYQ